MKAVRLFGLLFVLCGCSRDLGGATMVAGSAAPDLAPVSALGGAGQTSALLVLPADAGAIAAVRERVYPNGVRQDIALRDENAGVSGNAIEVDLGASPSAPEADSLPLDRPTAMGVRGEILARFPHMAMEIVQQPTYDRLGPIGLAIGRDGSGLRCVFAWQWIDDLRDVDPTRATILKAADSLTGSAAQASIRVRLCRRDRTLDQLAALVEGLALGSSANLRRVLSLDHDVIASGGEVSSLSSATALTPLPLSLESALGPAPPPVASRAPVRQAQRAPPPRRQPDAAPAELAPRPAGGARYLAPVGDEAPVFQEGRGVAPAVSESTGAGPALPAEALRGPFSGSTAAAPEGSAGGSLPAGPEIDSPTP